MQCDSLLIKLESPKTDLTETMNTLKSIRAHVIKEEHQLHQIIKDVLNQKGISYSYEHKLGKRNRVDFLTVGGTAIEAKKGKPNSNQILRQLERYASFDEVKAVVLVIERYMDLPEEINSKPCVSIGLNKLWGIASK